MIWLLSTILQKSEHGILVATVCIYGFKCLHNFACTWHRLVEGRIKNHTVPKIWMHGRSLSYVASTWEQCQGSEHKDNTSQSNWTENDKFI